MPPANSSAMPSAAEASTARVTRIEGTGRFIGDPPASPGIPESDGEGVTLNLLNVPIPQAAKTVLGDILGVQYVVDSALDGKVTLQTPKPVSKAGAVELFQSALRTSGATIVETGGVYKIVRGDQVQSGGRLRTSEASNPREQLASGVRVVQLKYVSAEEMKRVLMPISPRGGVIQADVRRNILTISGNPQEMASMLDAISIFDVDVMKGMSFALVPIRTSHPSIIAEELKNIFDSDREGPMAGMVRFLPNTRLGAILVISPQPGYLSRAEGWIRKLDAQAAGKEKQFYTYMVQNRRAKEMVDVLQSMFSQEAGALSGRAPRNVSPSLSETTARTRGFQSSSINGFAASGPVDANSGQSSFLSSEQSGDSAGRSAIHGASDTERAQFKIVADENKNAVLIEATKTDYLRIMRLIEKLDVAPNQVLIEATIAEITLTDDLKFGLRWHLSGKHTNYTFTDSATGAVSSVFPGFSYALKASNVLGSLNTLNQITTVNVISSPSLTVMDNKTATLQIGDQVPIKTQSSQSVTNADSAVINSISYKDTGVILSMTPRINQKGQVLLDIEQEVSTVVQTQSSGIDSPTIRQRRIKTSVMVNNGEAIALGGLIQSNNSVSRSQIPIAGDIPIIGSAFREKSDENTKTELIILITPRVIRDADDARQIADEYRKEFADEILRGRTVRPLDQTLRRTLN